LGVISDHQIDNLLKLLKLSKNVYHKMTDIKTKLQKFSLTTEYFPLTFLICVRQFYFGEWNKQLPYFAWGSLIICTCGFLFGQSM